SWSSKSGPSSAKKAAPPARISWSLQPLITTLGTGLILFPSLSVSRFVLRGIKVRAGDLYFRSRSPPCRDRAGLRYPNRLFRTQATMAPGLTDETIRVAPSTSRGRSTVRTPPPRRDRAAAPLGHFRGGHYVAGFVGVAEERRPAPDHRRTATSGRLGRDRPG